MAPTSNRQPELAMPIAALTALRHALAASMGSAAAAEALRSAGHAAGDAFYSTLTSGDAVDTLPARQFWQRFALLFSSRGWGQFRHEEAHPGVGSLAARDWVEASADPTSEQPSCHFTTGVLANLLGRVAGGDVAVLEVECRSRGDDRCRFIFGGSDAVFAVYRQLAEGEAPDTALARIG
jgi:uncharacterized protein